MRKQTVLHCKNKYKLLILAIIIFPILALNYSISQATNPRYETCADSIDTTYWKQHPSQGGKVVGTGNDPIWVIFERPIIFDSIAFLRCVDFRLNNFKLPVLFNCCTFDSMAYFRWAIFDTTSYFNRVKFDTTVIFNDAIFKSNTYFSRSVFNSNVIFKFVKFNSTAYFDSVSFKGLADFRRAEFDSTADFSEAIFDSTAYFCWANFSSKADFEEAQFYDCADFYKATLPDTLNLKFVDYIEGELDFTFCLPPKSSNKCLVVLDGADISKIKLRMDLFKLWFPVEYEFDSSYTRNYSRVADSLNYDQKTAIYEQLLKKFKDDGMMESYKILDIEYRKLKAKQSGFFNWYFLDTFLDYWWNYGYSKIWVFRWTLVFLLVFFTINLFKYRILSENVYSTRLLIGNRYTDFSGFKRAIYYGLYVFAYTAQIFFGLKMNMDNFKTGVIRKHPFLFTYLIAIYIMGLICLGFIVNIIFTK